MPDLFFYRDPEEDKVEEIGFDEATGAAIGGPAGAAKAGAWADSGAGGAADAGWTGESGATTAGASEAWSTGGAGAGDQSWGEMGGNEGTLPNKSGTYDWEN